MKTLYDIYASSCNRRTVCESTLSEDEKAAYAKDRLMSMSDSQMNHNFNKSIEYTFTLMNDVHGIFDHEHVYDGYVKFYFEKNDVSHNEVDVCIDLIGKLVGDNNHFCDSVSGGVESDSDVERSLDRLRRYSHSVVLFRFTGIKYDFCKNAFIYRQNTLEVFSSDHGANLPEWGCKTDRYCYSNISALAKLEFIDIIADEMKGYAESAFIDRMSELMSNAEDVLAKADMYPDFIADAMKSNKLSTFANEIISAKYDIYLGEDNIFKLELDYNKFCHSYDHYRHETLRLFDRFNELFGDMNSRVKGVGSKIVFFCSSPKLSVESDDFNDYDSVKCIIEDFEKIYDENGNELTYEEGRDYDENDIKVVGVDIVGVVVFNYAESAQPSIFTKAEIAKIHDDKYINDVILKFIDDCLYYYRYKIFEDFVQSRR